MTNGISNSIGGTSGNAKLLASIPGISVAGMAVSIYPPGKSIFKFSGSNVTKGNSASYTIWKPIESGVGNIL